MEDVSSVSDGTYVLFYDKNWVKDNMKSSFSWLLGAGTTAASKFGFTLRNCPQMHSRLVTQSSRASNLLSTTGTCWFHGQGLRRFNGQNTIFLAICVPYVFVSVPCIRGINDFSIHGACSAVYDSASGYSLWCRDFRWLMETQNAGTTLYFA